MRADKQFIVTSRATAHECNYDEIFTLIKAIAPNEGRCTVLNTSENVSLYHVLPRSLMNNDGLMDSIEWGWNMQLGQLNLDNPHNVIIVCSEIKEKLESRELILVPDLEIIKQIKDRISVSLGSTVRRRCFVHLNKDVFEYTLVYTKDFDLNAAITSRRPYQNDPESSTSYADLPKKIISHIRPEYIMAAAGYDILDRRHPLMLRVCPQINVNYMVFTFSLWKIPVDHEANSDRTYFPKTDHVESNSDSPFAACGPGRLFIVNPAYIPPKPVVRPTPASSHTASVKKYEYDSDSDSEYESGPSRQYSEPAPHTSIPELKPLKVPAGRLMLEDIEYVDKEARIVNWMNFVKECSDS